MVSKTVIFNNHYGMDTYLVMEIIRKARKFESKIEIECDGIKVKNKSTIMLSGLRIKMGSKIIIRTDGIDEEEALETISNLLGIEEDAYKQEIINRKNWKRIEQEEMEKDRNKSPEEIERELEEIVEEAATAEVKFTIGKRIKLYQNNPNSISLDRKSVV